MRRPLRSHGRLADEAGFLLVEVMVSAMILVVVSIGVFQALSQSDRLAGQQQKRATGGNIAQSEIERIRSMPVEKAARLDGTTRTLTEGGITYTIRNTSKWVTDRTANSNDLDCTTRTGGLDYMRITAEVTWNDMKGIKPVRISSILTPSSRALSSTAGSLSVLVRDQDDNGVGGLPITLQGTSYSKTETTNGNGCVVFPFVDAIEYKLSFSRAGYVTGDNVSEVNQTIKIAAGQTTKLSYRYAQGGFLRAAFRTRRPRTPGNGNPQLEPTAPVTLALSNPSVQSSPPFQVDLAGVTSWDASPSTPLFPASTPYTLYAGSCQENVPAPGSSTNPPSPTYALVPPNGGSQNAGTVLVPALDVEVYTRSWFGGQNPVSGAKVTFSAGCGGSRDVTTRTTRSDGKLADPGFPWTTRGTLCVEAGGRYLQIGSVRNDDLAGTSMPVDMSGSGVRWGSCS